jgi:diaminopimelate decarboxylase
VIDVREIKGQRLLTTNGSAKHLDPQMTGRQFMTEIDFVNTPQSSREIFEGQQVLCGFTCIEKDRFTTFSNREKLEVGDKITFKLAGAYTISFTPLFIEYFPAIFLKNADSTVQEIRKPWTVQEYVQNYIW